jgi:cytochrome c553
MSPAPDWLRLCWIVLPAFSVSFGATPGEEFRDKIQPVLARDCQGCHGPQQAFSKFSVTSREALLQGGQRGAALVPGKPEDSLLIHVLEGRNNLQMPPGGPAKKLPEETIAAFRRWIAEGAPWPDSEAGVSLETKWQLNREDLWPYQPLRKFDPSKTIDFFVNAKLAEKKLPAAPAADRRTLLRRVAIDLTGLPPAPEDVDAFLKDNSPNAFARVVDRLLASPRYGERWARHWLDVVRYADTNGYSNDYERPNAWRYRDYVVRAFNEDKPYDRFIKEQIAGDELYPGNTEALIATGFLRAGPWEHTAMSVEAVTRQLFLDDVTHATVNVFLGLTLGCARCHDHKFDPLPTKDYYRMQAVFASTEFARPVAEFLSSENTKDLALMKGHVQARYQEAQTKLAEYRQRALERLLAKFKVEREADLPEEAKQALKIVPNHLSEEEHEEFKLYQKHIQIFRESLGRFEPKVFAVSSGPLDGEADGGETLKYPRRADYQPATVHILPGGNIQAPAEAVKPGLLSALEKYGNYPPLEVPESIEGRRAALANWIADPRNPLTARVIVNRVWQYHFGKGIAADTSNFGKMGAKPSHPELLDHLAASLIANGWSIKKLHREILLSDAYQRSSRHPQHTEVVEKDLENRLLSYFPPRRVEAEVLRDSVLAVSGELSLEAGGPGTFPQINEDVARQPQHRMGSVAPAYAASPLRRLRNRRSIYNFQQRSLVDPMIEVFNGPSLDLSCERRESSTVPTQAFGLLNSEFAHDMALAFAVRLEREVSTLDARLERAFLLAFSRPPKAEELEAAKRHFVKMQKHHQEVPAPPRSAPEPLVHKITSELTGQVFSFTQQPDPAPYEHNLHPSEVRPETRALADVALVLFNTNEFVYIY